MAWCITYHGPKLRILVLFLCFLQVYGKKLLLIQLNEDNWDQMLQGEWMVEFFAPWCPACKALQPTWEDFSNWSDDLGIHVGQIDVTSNSGLSGRFMVTALPTIYHVKDGEFRQYRGSRDKEQLISFIEDKKWTSLDQVSWWTNPNSIQMTLVSYFFKLSMVLRTVHNHLVEHFKFPFWASILSFAVATIVIGAVLGLLLVCVADFMYPVKPPVLTPPVQSPKASQSSPVSTSESQNSEDAVEESSQQDNEPLKSRSNSGDELSDKEDKVRHRNVTTKNPDSGDH